MSILSQIIQQKQHEVTLLKQSFWGNAVQKEAYLSQIKKSEISFYDALQNQNRVWPRLIAEVKKGSPSQGLIRADFDVAEIVTLYDQYADAMSILTDEKFFLGSLENLKIARQKTNKPLLRKDFIIDEFQIYEARQAGADAVLLIAAVLNLEKMQEFLDLTYSLGMDALVEVHTEEELENVLKTNAKIIGINNRNLKDFSIDLNTSNRLAALIPPDRIIVSESGLSSQADLKQVRKNVDAVLIGTAITKKQDMESQLKALVGLPQIKICGITNLEDAQKSVEFGADYLGFIFYEPSPRYVSPEKAIEIIKKVKDLKPNLKAVCVFVNKKIEQILSIIQTSSEVDVIQLHGDESNDFILELQKALQNESLEIWKALRIQNKADLRKSAEFLNADVLLLDTYHKGSYGGTGKSFDWDILTDFNPTQKIALAGGIGSDNLLIAIQKVHPKIIDLSSRIEKEPGKKDLFKLQEIFKLNHQNNFKKEIV